MSYSEHSDKIIKAIHHKIMPLYMNPKTVNLYENLEKFCLKVET